MPRGEIRNDLFTKRIHSKMPPHAAHSVASAITIVAVTKASTGAKFDRRQLRNLEQLNS